MTTHTHQPFGLQPARRHHSGRRTPWLPHRVALGLVTVAIAIGSFVGLTAGVGADGPVPTEAYVVRSGDSLWAIAAPITAPGDDVRATIAEIVELNHLDGAGLVVGQELRLPLAP